LFSLTQGLRRVKLNATYCPYRGLRVFCSQCGFENSAGAIVCIKCTTPLPLGGSAATEGVATSWTVSPPTSAAPSRTGFQGTLQVGSLLGNRYEILQLLGEGGMGAVYKVRDRELDRFAALKVIRPELANNPEVLQRFKQELILARQVTQKNVIRIFDLGEIEGLKFITMDFVEGQDLRTLLREKGKFPAEDAVKIVAQVCRALDAAHSEGVVHRDLKPQNIMLDAQGRVTVMDFGIARSLEQPGMTQTGVLIGTPEYMSPEQAKGEEVDGRSDLFTLGIIFYELLTGKTPFRADTAFATMLKRTQERARPPVELEPAIPRELSNVVMKCLEIEPSGRYQSAQEILHDLEAGRGQQARTLRLPRFRTVEELPTKWLAPALAVTLLLTVGLLFRGKIFGPGTKPKSTGPTISLAILPFRNASGDASLDWLGSSLAEMLRTDVGQSSNLHTVSPDRLHQIVSDLRITSGADLDPATIRRIAEFTNADQVVSGQYVKLGSAVRIDATLQDLKGQRSTSLKAEASDDKALLGAVDQLARSIRESLRLAPSAVQELKAAAFTPSSQSVEALRDYSQGLELSRQANDLEAVKRFEAATEKDPNFALAFSSLGQTYARLGYSDKAEQFSSKAVDLSGSLPPAEKYMIQATDARISNNFEKAVEAYDNLVKLMPNDAEVQLAMGAVYAGHGALDQARDHYLKALQADPKYLDALLAVGTVEWKRGNAQGSLDYLNRALSLAVELNNQQGKANALHAIGNAYMALNRPADALQNNEQSLEITKQIGDKKGMAASLDAMAQIYEATGKPKDAERTYQQALQIEKEIGDQADAGISMMNLGEFFQNRGQYDEALNWTKQALQIEMQVGDQNNQAVCLNNIGNIYFSQGQYEEALIYFGQALDLVQKLNFPANLAMTLNNVGETYRKLGRYDQAMNSYLHALEVSRNAGDKLGMAEVSDSMAGLFEMQGRHGAALSAEQDALNNIREMQKQDAIKADIESSYGNALTLVGRSEEAQKSLDEALSLARSLQNNSLVAKALNLKGERLLYEGGSNAARPLFEQALEAATKAKDRNQALMAKFGLAKVSIQEAHAAAAVGSLKALSADADAMGEKYLSTQCSLYLGQALVESKNYGQARQELETVVRKARDSGMNSLLPQSHYWLAMALRGSGDQSGAAAHLQQASQLLGEMQRESKSDALLKRSDLRLIAQEAHP
jgi:serine/threonine protein kinase/lipopolysaccharide biosynthesis regulator YciM